MTNPSETKTNVSFDVSRAKCGWACRSLRRDEQYTVVPMADGLASESKGQPGDVIVARVTQVRNHTRVVTPHDGRVRLYEGDLVIGVLGNRYATDAFEAYAVVENDSVDMLTNAGMLGSVRQRNPAVKPPTRLEVIGQLADAGGEPINLIRREFEAGIGADISKRVVLMLGTGMNAGKTTSATKLVRGLMAQGHKVGALKVTGSVSSNDRSELAATGATYVRDFSDYGFPSTFLEDFDRLKQLFLTMVSDALQAGAETVVVELADGVLQRETEALIADRDVQACTVGAVLAAPCALSALLGCKVIREAGVEVLGVTGIINNAPLFVREFSARSDTPVLSSIDDGRALGHGVAPYLGKSVVRPKAGVAPAVVTIAPLALVA